MLRRRVALDIAEPAVASATPVATTAPSPSPSAAPAYPVTLTDDEGTAVTLAAAPQKIVSLTPATTEILFDLGAGDRIVATDDGSDFPAEAAALPDVATFSSVDTEKVVEAGADLVVAGGLGFTPAEAITKLRSLGIPVLVVYAPSVDGVLKDIELLGAAVGESDKATEITDGMRADMKLTTDAAAAEAAKAGAKPRVFYEIGYTDATGEIFAPGGRVVPGGDGDARRRRRDHHRRPEHLRDPAREADRARPAGHHPRCQSVLLADADGRRHATGLGRDDRRQGRHDPAGQRHRDHASGPTARCRAAGTDHGDLAGHPIPPAQ